MHGERQSRTMAAEPELIVPLTSDEALVLFDLLSRLDRASNPLVGLLERRAEQIALWSLSAAIEQRLGQPFAADYANLLQGARERLAATHQE